MSEGSGQKLQLNEITHSSVRIGIMLGAFFVKRKIIKTVQIC